MLLVVVGSAALPLVISAQEAAPALSIEVRIVARPLFDGRIEFLLQQRPLDGEWGGLRLPERRHFPNLSETDRWLVTSPLFLRSSADGAVVTAEARIAVRRLSDGRLEVALQVLGASGTWGDRLLPTRRFIPADSVALLFLRASPLVVTLEGGAATGEQGSTTDAAAGRFRIEDVPRSGDSLVAASYDRSCAVRLDGRVRCWGRGSDHDYAGVTGLRDVVAVTIGDSPAGMMHGCALHERGTVSCWGAGWGGQLGQGDRQGRLVPAVVPGIADAVAITAGVEHTCAVHADGSVSCWGRASHRQMAESSLSPRQVDGLSDVVTIAAGRFTTCAVHTDGTVSCWGSGFGRTPTKLQDLDGVRSVSVGRSAACAVRTDGTVRCWTYHPPGAQPPRTGAVLVENLSDVELVSAGDGSFCAVHTDGGVSCWGWDNSVGQIGDGTTRSRRAPARLPGIAEAVAITVSATSSEGQGHVCAMHADGSVSCWGSNGYGQLGDGTYQQRLVPTRVTALDRPADAAQPSGTEGQSEDLDPPRFTDSGDWTLGGGRRGGDTLVSATHGRTCAVTPDGRVSCWGLVAADERSIIAGLQDVVAVSHGGGWHTCVLHAGGTVSCWRHYPGHYIPAGLIPEVRGITDAVTVAAGSQHACAVHRDGAVSCWGEGGNGQLGDGSRTSYPEPHRVPGLTDVATIAAGASATCAIHRHGGLSCWGWQSNVFSITPSYVFPERIIGLQDVVAAGIGWDQICAVTGDGSVYCWPFADLDRPVRVQGITDAVAVAVGLSNACALHADGGVSCWGRNNRSGELGDGSTRARLEPARIEGIHDAVAISLGNLGFDLEKWGSGAHACAVHGDGTLSCWGSNEYGQLGDGTVETRLSPTRLGRLPDVLVDQPLPDESQLLRYHLEVFVRAFEEDFPWLRQAWEFIREASSFTYDVCAPAETCSESSGRVDASCEVVDGRFGCRASRLLIHGTWSNEFGHQLAHVYDRTTALTPDRAWGATQLYFSNRYPECYTVLGSGAGSEILADTLTYLLLPDEPLWYYRQDAWLQDRRGDFDRPDCPGLGSRPGAADVRVVRDGLAGRVNDWYSSNITNGAELWAALRRAPNPFIIANLAGEFGGLCRTDWITDPLDETLMPAMGTNPFKDGGC